MLEIPLAGKNANEIWVTKVGYSYLVIRSNGESRAYWLQICEHKSENGEIVPIWKQLQLYIEREGAFYLDGGQRTSNYAGADKEHHVLAVVLWALYNGISYEEAKAQSAHFARKKPVMLPRLCDDVPGEFEFRANYEVYYAWKDDIETDPPHTPYFEGGRFLHGKNGDTIAVIKGKLHYTGSAHGLYKALQGLSWMNNKGYAKVQTDNRETITMASAVWGYYHGYLTEGMIDAKKQQLVNLWEYMNNKNPKDPLECDHLTNVRSNNRPWAIAMMPKSVNVSFGGHRALIQEPYFFFMVYDQIRNECRVKCGIWRRDKGETRSYKKKPLYVRRFLFGDLTKAENASQCFECFNNFYDKVKAAGYYLRTKDIGKNSLLYWGTTAEGTKEGGADREDNPLPKMLKESRSRYKKYEGETFDKMPKLPHILTK